MKEKQTKALSLIAADGFGEENGLAKEIAEIRGMAIVIAYGANPHA